MKRYISIFIPVLFILFLSISYTFSQTSEIKPVIVEQKMPDFTLPIYGGGNLTLSSLKGKNILLIFLRGLAGVDRWCHICPYQYLEIADIEKNHQIKKKYNTEILFVLPYANDTIKEWLNKIPELLEDIEKWKNPPEPDKQNEKQKNWTETAGRIFPKKFELKKGNVPLPILVDGDRKTSKGLGLFTTEWGGSKADQNIPTVYIIDKEGLVQFKYVSQNTLDRPGYTYLFKFIERMMMK
jgi:peroxiredoxin